MDTYVYHCFCAMQLQYVLAVVVQRPIQGKIIEL